MAANECLGEDGLKELIMFIKAEFEKYTPTSEFGNSITIGDTTLTEAELIRLKALLN